MEKKIEIVLELNRIDENVLRDLVSQSPEEVSIVQSSKFGGNQDIVVAIVSLSIVTIPMLGKIIVELIRSKKYVKLKVKGVEIAGLSEKNAQYILEKLLLNDEPFRFVCNHPIEIEYDREFLQTLRLVIVDRFNEGELQSLCFDLGIEYENLPGESKLDKTRELISYLERRKQVNKLINLGKQSRPDIQWPKLSD